MERGGGYEQYLRDSFRAYFEFVVTDRTTFDLLLRNSATIRSFARDPLIIDEHARLAGGQLFANYAQSFEAVWEGSTPAT